MVLQFTAVVGSGCGIFRVSLFGNMLLNHEPRAVWRGCGQYWPWFSDGIDLVENLFPARDFSIIGLYKLLCVVG